MSEPPGMAQRGGVVESTVVLGGAQSPTISDNCADILLAFEPMEAVRALSKANADTIVITNTAPVVPFIPGGSAAYPPVDDLLACLRAKVGRVIAFDARKESLEAGNPLGLNMVMLLSLIHISTPARSPSILRFFPPPTPAWLSAMPMRC